MILVSSLPVDVSPPQPLCPQPRPRRGGFEIGIARRSILSSLGRAVGRAAVGIRSMSLRDLMPPLVILVLALCATGLATWNARRNVLDEASARFASEANELRDALGDALRTYTQILRASSGLVAAAEPLTREKWSRFVARLELDRDFPGIQGLGFAIALRPDEVARHEAEQRMLGRPAYKVHPVGQRPTYTAIVYLEPENWRNARALGFDMFSEPVRREAMERALRTGEVSLTGRVTLQQEAGVNVQRGTLLYLPVFHGGSAPSGQLRPLKGFVYAAFRMRDLVTRSLGRQAPNLAGRMELTVYDGVEPLEGAILFEGVPGTAPKTLPFTRATALLSHKVPLVVGGRTWTLAVSSTPLFERGISFAKPWGVALVGTMMSLLVSSIAATIAVAYARSLAAEQRLSQEVAARKQAQEGIQVANRELIHRAKNSFAVVSAIASQTARHSGTLAEFTRDFQDRLGALARVHDFLSPQQARATDLRTLVDHILQPYAAGREHGLVVRGPALPLPQNEALMFSLIINELATNATKYGAWSVPTGRVDLDWSIDQSGDGGMLALEWREHDGPPVQQPTRRGFGSNVLQFVIERSLGGKLATNFDPKGIVHTVSLPWPHSV
jgi:CHASE1-domain containing sensor protein/two-component sensor histidine kinase